MTVCIYRYIHTTTLYYGVVLQVKHLEVKSSRQEMPVQFTNFMSRNIRQKRHNKTTPDGGKGINP